MVGKLVLKITVMIIVVFGLSSYGLYLTTGKSPVSDLVSWFSAPTLPDLPELPKGNDTAYKWTDEKGVVHYGDAPPQTQQAKKMEVDPNANLLKSVKPEPTSSQTVKAHLNPMDTGGISDSLDKARQVQTLMDERHQAQKRAMGD